MNLNDSGDPQYHGNSIDIFSDDSIAITVTYISLGILTLIGNFMVCILYIKAQFLRTLTNRFVISSSIAGLLVGLLFVPFYLVLDTMTHAVSTLAMPISGFIASLTGFAMLFNVAALTYDRHIAIFRPLRYNELMTKRKTNLILAGVWLVPFILSATPMLLAKTIKSPEHIALCYKIYQGFLSSLLCVVICIVFAVYLRIAILTRKHLREERKDSYARSVKSVKSDISESLKNCCCFNLEKTLSVEPNTCLDEELITLQDLTIDIPAQLSEKERKISLVDILNHVGEHHTDAITAANTRRNSQTLQPNLSNLDIPKIYSPRKMASSCRKQSAITNEEFLKTHNPHHRKLSLDMAKFHSRSRPYLEHQNSLSESESIASPMTIKSSRVSFRTSTPLCSPGNIHRSHNVSELKNESDEEDVAEDTVCRTPLLRRQQRIKSDEFENVFRSIKYSPDVKRFSLKRNNLPDQTISRPRQLYTLNSNDEPVKNSEESREKCPRRNASIRKNGVVNPNPRRVSIEENHVILATKTGSFEDIVKSTEPKPKLKPKIKSKSLSLTKKSTDKTSRRHTLTVINFFGSNREIGIFSRLRKQFSSSSTKELMTSETSTSLSFISDWLKKRSSSTNVFAHARLFLHEIRVAKVLAIIFIINSLCWMPLIFINFADAFGQSSYISEELLMASQLLFMVNALVMPYVYAFCKKDFKQALKKQCRLFFKETIKFY